MTGRVPLFCAAAAGLAGAVGVALAAVSAHGAGEVRLAASAAGIALVHAPALLALAAAPRAILRFRPAAALLLLAGVALFSGDLALRFFTGARLFEGAAPSGGLMLIAGWITVAAGGFAAHFARPRETG